jgi:uncharacterized protein YhdP
MRRRKKWSFLWVLIPVLVVGILGYLFIHYFLDPTLYQKMVEESLTSELGREVIIGKAKISLWGGIGIAFEDLRVKDRSLAFDLLQSKRLILKLKMFPLLKGEVKWRNVILERATLQVLRDKHGKFNIFDATLTAERLKTSQQKMIQTLSTLFGGSLTLRDGKISFSDESLGPTPLVTEIHSFNLHLSKVSHDKPFPFRLSGEVSHSKKEGRFSMAGTVQNIPEDMDLSKGKVKAEAEIKGIETLHFWPYLKALLPMKTISGNLDLKAYYQGDFLGAFKASAKIRIKELVFDYPTVFAYTLKPKWMNLDLEVDYDRKDLRIPQLSIELPEMWVKAKGRIYEIGSKGMGLEAEAQSGPFDLSEGRKFIPYRIITPDVSEPLFRAEGSGFVQILAVKLSGKIPEIEHCDQPVHARTLSVEMRLDGARLKLPWNLPPLEDVKGHLDFKDGHLNLKEVEGRVFHSMIDRANGTFYQLLHVPTLQIHSEGRIDMKDLPSLMKIEGLSGDLSEIFSSINILSGRADYRLFTKVVLKSPLRFQHQGSYHLWKVRFAHPQIPFPILIGEGKIELSNEELQWSGVKTEFGESSFLMNGFWKREEGGNPFEMIAKGKGDLKNLFHLSQSSIFPEEIRSKTKWIEDISGIADLSFKGQSRSGLRFSSYEGEVIPKGIRLLPKGISSPVIFKEGTLSFSNLGVTFSELKAQSGVSSLTLDGVIKEGDINLSARGSIDLKPLHALLRSPLSPDKVRAQMDGIQEITGGAEGRLKWLGRTEEGISSLKEGEIRLKGVSLLHQKIPFPLSQIEGSLLLSSEQIRFIGLKGIIGSSPITLSGALSRISDKIPEARGDKPSTVSGRLFSFQISSPQLDLDQLLPKREEPAPTSFKKLRDLLSNLSFDGKVEVDQGKCRGLPYQNLQAEMKTLDGKLFLNPFQFKGFGGDLWGEGWVQPTERGVRFEIKPRLSNMEAKAFLRTLMQKGEEEKIMLTGRVSIDKVELRGEGEDFQKVKESLSGKLRLELENGVIERGNILAKIFSILNVSQWFLGRLPDLKTRGLPYHTITATIDVNHGVASTEDFIVDSDAMRITLLGEVDVGKNRIDATIGVHPLVTLDVLLSHVPIAGYILTGKDNAFLSYIYEVKGDLDDPKIEAVPIKGLGENFWGIIQRLLETPLRPFQKSPSPNNEKNG